MASRKKVKTRRFVRRWTRPFRHALALAGLRGLIGLCRLLSHRAALSLARRLGALAWKFPSREKEKTRRNLELVLGENAPAAERESIGRQAFESAAMTAIETIHALHWTPERFKEAIALRGDEHWRAAFAPGRGVVMVTAHLGNWELTPPAFYYYSGIAVGVMMRSSRNPFVNEMILRTRASRGNPVFTEDSPPISYFKILRKGGALGLLADQDTRRLKGMFVEFFGRPAITPIGPAFLARKTGAAFIPAFITRLDADPTRHDFRFLAPMFPDPALSEDDDIRRMLQYYSTALEEAVRAAPGQWMWMHERWKRQPKAKKAD